MKLVLLAVALVAIVALSDARPQKRSAFKGLTKRSALMKAAKKSIGVEDVIAKLENGFSDDELAEIAQIATNVLGEDVSVEDVEDFLDEFDDMMKAALESALAEMDQGMLQVFEALLDSSDLGKTLDDMFGSSEEKRQTQKRNLADMLDDLDLDADDLNDIAEAVLEELGTDVSADDVEDFLEAHGEEVEEAVLKAAEGLDHDQFKELEHVLNHPDLLGDVLEHLKDEGLIKKRGFLPDLDDAGLAEVAQKISEFTGEQVTADNVDEFFDTFGGLMEDALVAEAKKMSPDERKAMKAMLHAPEPLAHFLIEVAQGMEK